MTQVDAIMETLSHGDAEWEEQFLKAAIEFNNAVDWINAALEQLNSARTELTRLLDEKNQHDEG